MAEYNFRYRLTSAPQARNDGSAMLAHDIAVEASSDGENWFEVPARHKTILVPAAEASSALEAGTNNQIVQAYKQALAANLNTMAEPITGWTTQALQALMDANDAASQAAVAFDVFVTETLGLSYPVRFTF